MAPDLDDPNEVEGVLNPASGRDADGRLWLLPRLVAAGNVSRVGLAEVEIEDGVPVGVRREAVVLEPDAAWERGADHGGVEDPRVTWMADLGLHLMTYVAYGPLGPRPALAVSEDLRTWKRLGPFHFEFQADLDTDLNLYPNKDMVIFPEPVPGPDGRPSYAVLHRPMWDLDWIVPGAGTVLPAGMTDDRPGIWISYVSVEDVADGHRRTSRICPITGWSRCPQFDFEALKIGAGPPPIRVPEGWLLIHHGVSGQLISGFDQQQRVHYARRRDDPVRRRPVAWCWPAPSSRCSRPETDERTLGIVPNVVVPDRHRRDRRPHLRVLRHGRFQDRRRRTDQDGRLKSASTMSRTVRRRLTSTEQDIR